MASRFSLAADVVPTVDETAAERSGRNLAETLEGEIGDLSPGIGDGLGGIGGAGGGITGGGGGGGGGAIGSLAAAARGGGALSVALGGAIGFGLLSGVSKLASASPALQQTATLFSDAMGLFFRPFGRFLGNILRPAATGLLNMALNFNEIASEDGLAVALASVADGVVSSLASGFGNALTNLASGDFNLGDILFAGAGGLTAAKVLGFISWPTIPSSSVVGAIGWPKIGAAAITGAIAWGNVQQQDIVGSIGWGTVTGALVAGALGWGTVTGGAVVGGLTFGTITGAMILEEAFGGGKPDNFDAQRELETFLQRNVSGADPRLSPREARRQAFQRGLEQVQARENLNRADLIEAFRAEFGREPPETGVPGGGGRGEDAGADPPSPSEVEDLVDVLESIEDNTDTDDGGDTGTSDRPTDPATQRGGADFDPF